MNLLVKKMDQQKSFRNFVRGILYKDIYFITSKCNDFLLYFGNFLSIFRLYYVM